MPRALVYSSAAQQDIKKLDPVVKKRLGKRILILQNDPLAHSKKLVDFESPTYRFRVGHYRVIFELNKDQINILRVGHRSQIYK